MLRAGEWSEERITTLHSSTPSLLVFCSIHPVSVPLSSLFQQTPPSISFSQFQFSSRSRSSIRAVMADTTSREELQSIISIDRVSNWLEKHFGRTVSVTKLKYEDPPQETADYVLSDIVAVNVSVENEGEDQINLIVKLLPNDPFSRYFVTEAQFDLREIKFYDEVVPDLLQFQKEANAVIDLPIPKCFYSEYNVAGSELESVLVLDNLKHRGFHSVPFSTGLSLAQCRVALEAVSRVHALTLAMKHKNKLDLDEKYPFLFKTPKATDSYQQLVERGLPQLATFLESKPGLENILASLQELRPRTKDTIAELLRPEDPLGLITHTDFWCNNLLFNENSSQCMILDWQMICYSRATNDIALLLVSSLSSTLRREHTQSLLDYYWTHLTEHSASLGLRIEAELKYDRAQLGKDYRQSLLLALLLCIGSVDVALGNPDTEQRLVDVLQDLYDEGVLSGKTE
uniref:Uncharacterized oxidoreductase dhs-27 n=1 Tax=Cacopsylla melanoneura TaxID=428564 RepID=A0A8D8ZHQ4_9HEMI